MSGTEREVRRQDWASGWSLFAAVIMITVGIFSALDGLAAIIKDQFFVVVGDYAFKLDVTAWGWIHLVLGILLVVTGYFVLQGAGWARGVGIGLAVLSAIANFLALPYYPFWADPDHRAGRPGHLGPVRLAARPGLTRRPAQDRRAPSDMGIEGDPPSPPPADHDPLSGLSADARAIWTDAAATSWGQRQRRVVLPADRRAADARTERIQLCRLFMDRQHASLRTLQQIVYDTWREELPDGDIPGRAPGRLRPSWSSDGDDFRQQVRRAAWTPLGPTPSGPSC